MKTLHRPHGICYNTVKKHIIIISLPYSVAVCLSGKALI